MPSQSAIRQQVAQQIIAALEQNLVPWRRPWRTTVNGGQPGRHSNVNTKRPYQGVNLLLLQLHALRLGLMSRWWGTFPMWKSLGCNIKKRPTNIEEGCWGCKVVLYRPVTKTVVDNTTGEEEDERFFVMRTFTVFNADQVTGDEAERYQVHEEDGQPHAEPDFAPAEELIAATGADIRHGGERAFYSVDGDYIQMPSRECFGTAGAYYETALHELSHWSEPRQQLDRQHLGYAMCELVAEISACLVSSEVGIPNGETLDNHAAYLRHWLDAMRADHSFIFKASKLASKTADYLLGFADKPEPEASGIEVLA